MNATDQTLSLEVAAKPESVAFVRRSLASHIRDLKLDEDDAHAISLAVGEACSNAVLYGAQAEKDPHITVTCDLLQKGRLQIEIQNPGNGFHPDIQAMATPPDPDHFSEHGRGFALMNALMDQVEVYSLRGNTVVRLVKYLPG